MPLRPLGLRTPPPVDDPSLQAWMRSVTDAINGLPFSFFSTSDGPNASLVTAPRGTLGLEIGSSSTRFWIKSDVASRTTGWKAFSTGFAYSALHHKFDNSVHTQAGVGTSFAQYRGFDTLGISSDISSSITDDDIVVLDDGIYETNFDISMTGTNNTQYDFELFKNGVDQGYGFTLDTGSSGDVGNGAFHSIITAESGDSIAIYVKSDAGGGADVVTHASNFVCKRLSPTSIV